MKLISTKDLFNMPIYKIGGSYYNDYRNEINYISEISEQEGSRWRER